MHHYSRIRIRRVGDPASEAKS